MHVCTAIKSLFPFTTYISEKIVDQGPCKASRKGSNHCTKRWQARIGTHHESNRESAKNLIALEEKRSIKKKRGESEADDVNNVFLQH